jgi:signal transduction histidine kinase
MSLKFRLAILFSLSVFIILLASAVSIFLFNESFRKEEFTKRLVLEGSECMQLYLSVPGPPKSIIEELNQKAVNFGHKENIFLFSFDHKLLYSTPEAEPPNISPGSFEIARKNQVDVFPGAGREAVLLSRVENSIPYFVYVSGFDIYGRRKSDNLKILLTASVLGGLILSGFLAFFYVRHAMAPLEELKNQIEKINEKNLKERIPVVNKNNEVWQIAKKFNAMLDRLEQAFEQRKNFVRHASHELRTPLANMLSQTESALGKNLSVEDYRSVLFSLKEDQQDLIELTNSLLTLSKYGKRTDDTEWTTIRIDDLLYQVAEFSQQMWPEAMVAIDFETVPENENELEFRGNESLVRSALQNLVKNAIHYSDDSRVKISILTDAGAITLHFENKGNQLNPEEQQRLFIPFFRGENASNKKGYGLGLSIVQRIINVHNGSIKYEAVPANLNRFTIYLPSQKKQKNPAKLAGLQ